jgi:ABC-type uncharacterized transport system permease subunit
MFPDLADRTWLWGAAGFYLAGFVLGTIALLRGGRPSGVANYLLIVAGYTLQFIGMGLRGRAVAGTPIGNTFELFQFTAWSAISLYLVVGVTFRSSLLGYFTSCLAAVLTLVSLAIPAWDATRRVHLFGGNPLVELHAPLALFSYGVFALLALTSIMYLARDYSLKSKRLGGWFSFLPSIIDLDQIGVRLLGAGVTILTASVGVIVVYYLRDVSTATSTKILATVAVWLAYLAAFGFRLGGKLAATRFAWTCLVLFALALLSLWPVDASRHPAARPTASAHP